MERIDICCGGEYASKWALTDWYEESEKILREAIESGEDFDTGYFGCRKEIRYGRIRRENGVISVEVSAHMDDLYDGGELIYDALWEVSKSEEELPDDIIESIRDSAVDCGINDFAAEWEDLPPDATFADVDHLISVLEDSVESQNEENFSRLCDIVKDHVEYMKSDEYRKLNAEEKTE